MKKYIQQNPRSALIPLPIKIVLFLFFILPLVTCPVRGQVVQKKELSPSDYHLWSTLTLNDATSDGNWVIYKLQYQNGIDTISVRHTTQQKVFNFTGISNYQFLGSNRFIYFKDKILAIFDLHSGKTLKMENVTSYAYSKTTNQLIILKNDTSKTLLILNAKNEVAKKLDRITQFSLSPSQKDIIYTSRSENSNKVGLLTLQGTSSTKWITQSPDTFDHFTWQENANAVVFFSSSLTTNDHHFIFYYNLQKDTFIQLDATAQDDFPHDKIISFHRKYDVAISPDLQKVFFAVKSKSAQGNSDDKNVELWNGNAKWIYPQEKYFGALRNDHDLVVWFPFLKKIKSITTTDLPNVMFTSDFQYALLSNPQRYEPQYEHTAPRDFYLKNINTDEQTNIISNLADFNYNILPSPCGKFISYFKGNNWWVYDIENKSHKNITAGLKVPLLGKVNKLGYDTSYGSPGWSQNDQEMIIYDQYDIWAVTPNGASRKLTNGRDKKVQFRMAHLLGNDFLKSNYDGLKSSCIDLKKTIILRAEGDDGKTGYFKWDERTNEKALVYKFSYVDQIYYNEKNKSYVYQQQNFDQPPSLVFQKENNAPRTFFQSNPQQQSFYWGRSELVEYTNSKNEKLKGILYYPSNYKAEKKYPMIVHVYEKQSNKVHLYNNPSLLLQAGYNPTVFTLNGYFVLCPDIKHETGNVGAATLDCVTAAVSSVIKKGVVSADKIGLIGHSFGGYESVYLITQTDIFAAAVAGAAVTDLNSFYLTVGWNTGRPDMWRFQSEQFRMGTTPFKDPSIYLKNSPLAAVNNIKTPLLLWTGKKDFQVDWHQSVEFYLALRQLQKKNIMLLYPDEGHILSRPDNQKDLSIRVQQWLDYFLKKQEPEPWIKEGLN
jgi:dipeptidyl aminopeptidase/acylaminoacyl peptidase